MVESVKLIEDEAGLAALILQIEQLGSDSCIALDTEFIRTRTYYPKLALLQLCLKGEVYLCDPLQVSFCGLFKALNHTEALVLTFAAKEDLEVISAASRRFGFKSLLPKRCLDLQLLLSFLNLSHGLGLQNALDQYLGVKLNKDQTTSDWLQRPLTCEQLCYAASDVLYLERLYFKLKEHALCGDERIKWCFMAMETLKEEESALPEPRLCYQEVQGAGRLPKKNLAILQYLCQKRMEFAMGHDIALNLIITSKSLCKLAKNTPLTMQGLASCDMKWGAVREHGELVISWIKEALSLNVSGGNLPLPHDFYACKKDYGEKFKRVKDYLVIKSKEKNIRPELIASKKLINNLFFALSQNLKPQLHGSWYVECAGRVGESVGLFKTQNA